MKNKKLSFSETERDLIRDILYFGSAVTHAGTYFVDKNGDKVDLRRNLYQDISDVFLDIIKSNSEIPLDIFLFAKVAFENALNNLGIELETITSYTKDEVDNVANKFEGLI